MSSSDAGSSQVEDGKNNDANLFGERDLHRLIAPVSDMEMFRQNQVNLASVFVGNNSVLGKSFEKFVCEKNQPAKRKPSPHWQNCLEI